MEALDLIDFDAAGDVSGSKFYYLKNAAAMLELGLVNMAMQVRMRLAAHACACALTPCQTPPLRMRISAEGAQRSVRAVRAERTGVLC